MAEVEGTGGAVAPEAGRKIVITEGLSAVASAKGMGIGGTAIVLVLYGTWLANSISELKSINPDRRLAVLETEMKYANKRADAVDARLDRIEAKLDRALER